MILNGRKWAAEEKLQILDEARRAGQAVSDVCRRHQIAPSQFYEWERQARAGALEDSTRRNGAQAQQNRSPSERRSDASAHRRRRVERGDAPAEKGALAVTPHRRYAASDKQLVLDAVRQVQTVGDVSVRDALQHLGIGHTTYYRWTARA